MSIPSLYLVTHLVVPPETPAESPVTVRYRRSRSDLTGDRRRIAGAAVIRYDFDVTLARTHNVDDGLEALRSRVAELEGMLSARDAEIANAKSDLDAFRVKYRGQVGTLHEQLDELERAIAEAEFGELSKQGRIRERNHGEPPAGAQPEPTPRLTSDAVRKLFRDVAKTIHPDLAQDEHTRDRRHTLMIEANRAYALGDEEQLRWILQAWERSPEAVQGSDPEAMRLRLLRRIAQVEEQLDMSVSELAELKDSPLWKLKTMVDEAAAKGKDLIREMVGRLKRDIMVATNRLDAMRPPS